MKKNYIGIREARINLSRLIKDVREGMEIVITDRGKPVARLIPAQGTTLSLEERIRNYECCGLIQPREGKRKAETAPVELPGEHLKDLIEEERQDE